MGCGKVLQVGWGEMGSLYRRTVDSRRLVGLSGMSPYRSIIFQTNTRLPMQVDDPRVFKAVLHNIICRQDAPVIVWDGKGLSSAGTLCQLTS